MCAKKYFDKNNEDKDKDEGGSQGSSGKDVGVRVSTFGDNRDEPKNPRQLREFNLMHEATQRARLVSAKEKIQALAETRAKKDITSAKSYSHGIGLGDGPIGGEPSEYKPGHYLEQFQQFDGREESVIAGVAGQSDLNEDDQKELVDRPENKLQNQYKNTPKYSNENKYTPKLKR